MGQGTKNRTGRGTRDEGRNWEGEAPAETETAANGDWQLATGKTAASSEWRVASGEISGGQRSCAAEKFSAHQEMRPPVFQTALAGFVFLDTDFSWWTNLTNVDATRSVRPPAVAFLLAIRSPTNFSCLQSEVRSASTSLHPSQSAIGSCPQRRLFQAAQLVAPQ